VATREAQSGTALRQRTELCEAGAVDRAEWDELADRAAVPPFSRPGWIDAYWRAFATGQPVAIVVRRGDRLAGVLPLERRRGVLRSATNWQTPLFGPVAEDAEAAVALAEELFRRVRRRADLGFLDREALGLAEARSTAEAAGLRTLERTMTRAPYVPIEGSFDEFMAGLERKFRKEIGRRWRRLEDQGEVEVAYEDGSRDLDLLLDEGFRLEGSGWKSAAGTAIASDPVRERFYREVCAWAATRGWLTLAFLRVGGRAVAFDLCIEVDRTCYVLKGGFDTEARSLGPGVLLTHDELRRAFEAGFTSYELLGEADEYKLHWTRTVRERVRLQVFPRSPLGGVEHAAWRRGRTAAKRARATLGRLQRRQLPSGSWRSRNP